MITHTSEWFTSVPKSKQDKVKVTNFKKLPKLQILQKTLHATHLLKLLDNMYMDPTRTVGATELTQDAGRTDRQTDGRTEWNQYTPPPPPPPTTSLCWGYDNSSYDVLKNPQWMYKSHIKYSHFGSRSVKSPNLKLTFVTNYWLTPLIPSSRITHTENLSNDKNYNLGNKI